MVNAKKIFSQSTDSKKKELQLHGQTRTWRKKQRLAARRHAAPGRPEQKKEFMEWFLSEKWSGAHPFEIVYSTPHGIILYPPDKDVSGESFVDVNTRQEIYPMG